MLVESSSGIRGLYKTELTKEVVAKYAQVFEKFLLKRKSLKIVIGRDARESGKDLFNHFINHFDSNVIDIGVLPTPVVQNAVREFNADGGLIITGSHLYPEYNGLKLLDKNGAQLIQEHIKELIKEANKLNEIINKKEIKNKREEALTSYINFVKKIIKNPLSNNKVIIDPNGGAGIFFKKVFDEFKVNAHYINMNLGEFKREIEPHLSSLKYLKEEIEKHDADFAAGFDCDADRISVILRDGTLLSGNHLLGIVIEDILSELPNPQEQTIVVNEATSYLVKDIVDKYNAKYKEVGVGEINVVDEMIKCDSLIGGEGSSGGVIIAPSKCRDGALTLIYLLSIIHKRKESLSEILSQLPNYYYLEDKVICVGDFPDLKQKIKTYYSNKGFMIQETEGVEGGVKVIKENSWLLIRPSKTEDKMIRIITNSKEENIAENLLKEAKILLQQAF